MLAPMMNGDDTDAVHHGDQHAGIRSFLQKAGHPLLHVFNRNYFIRSTDLDVHAVESSNNISYLHKLL